MHVSKGVENLKEQVNQVKVLKVHVHLCWFHCAAKSPLVEPLFHLNFFFRVIKRDVKEKSCQRALNGSGDTHQWLLYLDPIEVIC